ncbi:ATP-binding protein [Parabacteroides sp. PF5-6]|uniref:ATP-binding protein n=1 Tax=Parabacteroides sp. PF5-6 TaxID=1742403 RepID=UPI002404E3B2|nr:ATP-binding protein [Parabacteroides sp. PF5-6]MDF9831767.1 signal transduction histidine kinase/CheY-like chemotaxis protein [Parabacteroides sp. PF5-6]
MIQRKTNVIRGIFYLFVMLLGIMGKANAVSPVEGTPQSDYILLINPDAETCAWGHMIIPAIVNDLRAKYPEYEVRVEYMYGLGVNSIDGVEDFQEYLFAKYPVAPRYLMLFESDMYSIMHESVDRTWGPTLPTLLITREEFFGDVRYWLERQPVPEAERTYFKDVVAQRENLVVVQNPFDIAGTLKIMKTMLPQMKKLVLLTDGRYISAENRKMVEDEVRRNYPEWGEVEHLTQESYTTDEVIHKFIEMPSDETGVLYFTWFNNDLTADKDLILQTNAYRIFSLYVNGPVFTINDVGLRQSGMLGGSYTPFPEVLNTVYKATDEMIAGTIKNRNIYCPPALPTFNYMAMRNHDIALSAIPSNAYLYNRPLTFLERNKNLILGLAIVTFLSFILMRIVLLIQRRKMQDKEIKLLERYSDLFNHMPIAYRQEQLITNSAGQPVDVLITEVNPGYEKQLTPREEIIGRRGSVVNPDMYPGILNIYAALMEDKNKKISLAYYHQETDRYFSVISAHSSTPGFIDSFFVDTTELQRTQQLLQSVNNKLVMSLDVANITPWKWDVRKATIICDVNKPVELYTQGIRTEEQISIPQDHYFDRIFAEDKHIVNETMQKMWDGELDTARCEFRIYKSRSKHSYDWVEIRGAVETRDADGKPVSLIGTSLIVTDRKNIEDELRTAKDKAEESNRLKSAFLANMSHEIRTPLNAIVGFSNILAATEQEEDKQEYISIIENNNNLLLQLVSDILDLSKIEAGTMEFHYSDMDLNVAMGELREAAQDRAAKEVEVIFEKMLPDCFIRTEKARVTQVMTNILANAAKFTTEGSIRFGYEVKNENMLYFYVTDTGCGISRDQQEQIFGRFVKLNHFVQGTGLGLSLCQMIINRMDGEIGVESEEGKGTTFWFTIPYVPVNPDSPTDDNSPTEMKKDKLKVLIAEDNLSNFELFEAILRNDYNIIHAWNGKEALDLFQEHQPHIVLMDINMPKMNGYEATLRLRQISKDVPIIAVTAYGFSNDERQIRKNGFSGYSPKPLNPQTLKNQMVELLNPLQGVAL